MNKAELLVAQALQMKEGQCLTISRHDFDEAFPKNPYVFGDQRPPVDRFLEKLPGVNYGAYELNFDEFKREYRLCRFECGKQRTREDWDRR